MKNILKLSLFILLVSCNKTIDMDVVEIDIQQISNKSFNDFYEIKSIIPLETNEMSFLYNVDKILFVKDRIFLQSFKNMFNSTFYTVFDSTGKFIYKHNREGRGPGEYVNITHFMSNGDTIIVSNNNKLLYYDIDGEFIKEKIETQKPRLIAREVLPDGTFLLNYSMVPEMVDGRYCTIQRHSSEGVIKTYLPIPEFMAKAPFFSYNPFLTKNGKTYITPLTHQSIYMMDHKNYIFNELYQFRQKGSQMYDVFDFTEEDVTKTGQWINKKLNINLLDIDEEYLTAIIMYKDERYLAFVDRRDNSVDIIHYLIGDELHDKTNELPLNIVQNNSEYLISLVEPVELIDREFHDSNSTGARLAETLDDDSNPVIIIYQRKK